MAEDETQTIELKTKKAILDHIIDEPRFFFTVGKDEQTMELLEPLKGKHKGDLNLKLKAGNSKLTVRVAEIGGYVCIKKKYIDGRRWRHYYGIKFAQHMDGTLWTI